MDGDRAAIQIIRRDGGVRVKTVLILRSDNCEERTRDRKLGKSE